MVLPLVFVDWDVCRTNGTGLLVLEENALVSLTVAVLATVKLTNIDLQHGSVLIFYN